MFKKFSTRTIVFVFLLFVFRVCGQNYSIKELDSITKNLKYVGKYDQAIKFNIHYLKIYEKIKDKQGIVASCTNLGNLLASVSKYSESIKYLNKGRMK